MSVGIADVFESAIDIDPDSAESELRIQVERLERMTSAAAAAQARPPHCGAAPDALPKRRSVFRSTAPPLPGPPIRTISVVECG